ncbi:MAG: hypothetical protein OXG13_13125 [Gemmatimonadaceae bacterium]|nr:hypothetical protein [Gemmatimonadaceae bacterium]
MIAESTRSWWESLRHFGLLLSPDVVNRIETTHAPPGLPRYRRDQLRRELNRRESGDLDAGRFVAWVLDKLCGFEGREGIWTRGPSVPQAWTQTLVTGEGLKPRHVWTGHRGGALPVFFDNSPMLGQGRGRKVISDCAQWLRKAHRPLALVTNGRQWRLLYAGLDFEAACEWDTELWFEQGEPGPQLEALRTLLQPALVASTGKDQPMPLVTAIQDSRKGQSELSASMGERVREAVEALVHAHGPSLSSTRRDIDGPEIYLAAVRVVMRLVVTLFAETRELLPRSEPTYENSYGLQGLFQALQRVAVRGQTRLSHRFGAWPRILGLFRVIHEGADHPSLGVPAYGGELFAPGNPDDPDPVNRALAVFENACFDPRWQLMPDAVVYELLELLMLTQVRVRQGRATTRTMMPVDFAGLSTEYIGVLYEGLLDYELRTAPEDDPVLFLAVGNEPALPLSALEAMDDRQIRHLFEAMKGSPTEGDEQIPEEVLTDQDTEDPGEEDWEPSDQEAEANTEEDQETSEDKDTVGEETRQRALDWASRAVQIARLVPKPKGRQTPEKQLAFERQLVSKAEQLAKRVVEPGEWYLVRWRGTRKGSGTYYTRPQLAVPTVHRTLRPLAYTPPVVDHTPRQDAPPEQWTARKPEEILGLKVCDPSCGSGSFLVAAVRFLTEALYNALHEHDRLDGDWRRPVDQLLGLAEPSTEEESLQGLRLPCPPEAGDFEPRTKAILRRYVVEHCIYGVDLDPLAVELCRLALWLETMDRELPFSFLDHKIKCGNSLVGAWFDQFRHYPAMAWKNREGGDKKHSNGVHSEKNQRGRALKAFYKETLIPDFLTTMKGQWQLGDHPDEEPSRVHDELVQVLEGLHSMPLHDTTEQTRRYRLDFLGSLGWRSLKEAFDLWCASWYWPPDSLDAAPVPSRFHKPDAGTTDISQEVASKQRFFHWELEFPDVYRRGDSGFDAIMGNPPWEVAKPNSHEFFSNIDPLYRSYGKQEALRKQTDYFAAESQETAWLDYQADFRSQSNYSKYAAFPFGDPATADDSLHRFSPTRGKKNAELHAEWRASRATSKGYADPEHAYRYQGSADVNLFKLFLERGHSLLRTGGRMGLIVPSGIYSDHGTGALRKLFLDKSRWEWLFGFENREKVFDIHRSFKFNPVIIEKGGRTEAISTAFMRRRLDDWETAEAHVTPYERRQVERFSPKSRSILEIQSSRDLEILEKIYANSVLLGDDGPDGWQIEYVREFDMTNDSDLFPPRPQWEERGYQPDEYSRWLKGGWEPRTATCPAPPGAKRVEIREGIILSRDGRQWIDENRVEDVALPLYEGRMIGQFDYSQKGWVSGRGRGAVWREIPWESKQVEPQFLMGYAAYEAKLVQEERDQAVPIRDAASLWVERSKSISFMDICSATNERTTIAAVTGLFPNGHSAPVLKGGSRPHALSAILNSLVWDFAIRRKLAGLHLVWAILEDSPTPSPQCIPHEVDLSALRLTASPKMHASHWLQYRDVDLHPSEAISQAERSRLRAMLDASIAMLYGLDESDLSYILTDCDLGPRELGKKVPDLDPKGFWRVERRLDPELRHTVLSRIALADLTQLAHRVGDVPEAIRQFLAGSNPWQLPEKVTLADYGLGHDDQSRISQPVRSRLGPGQTACDMDEFWSGCELHARNVSGHSRTT